MKKILFLCNKSPYPAREGGPMAMNSLIQGLLNAGHQVKVLAVNSAKYHVTEADIPDEYRKQTGIELVNIDLRIKPMDAFLNLFSTKSYHVQRFISENFREKLVAILHRQQFDVVQLESLFMVPYVDEVRKHCKARIVLRAHNIEHLIWKRLAQQCRNPLKKYYLSHLARTLERYEKNALAQVDGIAAITRKDAAFFRGITATPVIDLPFGVKISPMNFTEDVNGQIGFFHIGAMNWMPNEEGLRWFLNVVWPEVHHRFPQARFHLAGRYMPSWLVTGVQPGVEVWGEVENATDFVNQHQISIVPLLSGSGIRIKIIEAMAAAKTVITTEIGAEGIHYQNEKNIFIANTKEEFLYAISRCLKQPGLHLKIGRQARQLVEQIYDQDKIAARLLLFYERLQKRTAERLSFEN